MRSRGRLNGGRGLQITDYDLGVVGFPALFEHRDRERWLALTSDQNELVDPWQTESTAPFPIPPHELLSLAKQRRPSTTPNPTVSAFADWVYSLYVSYPGASVLRAGRNAEEAIFLARSELVADKGFTHFQPPGWGLVYNGLELAQTIRPKPYTIHSLRVAGTPLSASPDLVFRSPDSAQLIIVEIKFSSKRVPANLWPNVWAQLWAYSKIPEYSGVPRLLVVGEVWGFNDGYAAVHSLELPVYLRKSVSRNPRASAYDKFFDSLFQLYGGTIEKSGKTSKEA